MELDAGALSGLMAMSSAVVMKLVAGILGGHIIHIVKKMREEVPGASELNIFYRYIIQRPFTTAGSVLGSLAASMALFSQVSGATTPGLLLAGFLCGFAANSGLNRAGN